MADLHFVDFALILSPVRKEKQFRLPHDFSEFDLTVLSRTSHAAFGFPTLFRRSIHITDRPLLGDPQKGVSKTQTLGCLENSDPEKTQTLVCLENSDPKNKTYLHRVNAASRLVYCSLIQWHYHNLPRKEKQFIVS